MDIRVITQKMLHMEQVLHLVLLLTRNIQHPKHTDRKSAGLQKYLLRRLRHIRSHITQMADLARPVSRRKHMEKH